MTGMQRKSIAFAWRYLGFTVWGLGLFAWPGINEVKQHELLLHGKRYLEELYGITPAVETQSAKDNTGNFLSPTSLDKSVDQFPKCRPQTHQKFSIVLGYASTAACLMLSLS